MQTYYDAQRFDADYIILKLIVQIPRTVDNVIQLIWIFCTGLITSTKFLGNYGIKNFVFKLLFLYCYWRELWIFILTKCLNKYFSYVASTCTHALSVEFKPWNTLQNLASISHIFDPWEN